MSIKIENIEVCGMRNPMNSWGKQDSSYIFDSNDSGLEVIYVLLPRSYKEKTEHD